MEWRGVERVRELMEKEGRGVVFVVVVVAVAHIAGV